MVIQWLQIFAYVLLYFFENKPGVKYVWLKPIHYHRDNCRLLTGVIIRLIKGSHIICNDMYSKTLIFHTQCICCMSFKSCVKGKSEHQETGFRHLAKTKPGLTYWGRVTHICVSKLTIIGSDNGLSPDRCQAIIWTKAAIVLIGPLGTNFSEILIEILSFSFKKCVWKCRLRNGGHFVSASMC